MQDKNKKAELSQRWPRDAPGPYMSALKVFGNPWVYAHGYFFRNFNGLFPIDAMHEYAYKIWSL